MSWERPDPPRDEDRYYEDESMVPDALLTLSGVGANASELARPEPSTAHQGATPESGGDCVRVSDIWLRST